MAAEDLALNSGRVPIFAAFGYGFREAGRHFKSILPLSFFFFLPELVHKLGWMAGQQVLATEIYKVAIFFFLLLLSMRLTKPKYAAPAPEGVGLSFLGGELIKWSLTLAGLAVGAGLLYACYRVLHSPALQFLQEDQGLWAALKAYALWLKARPWPELAATTALLGALPFYFFIVFNFFGYIIVDTGAGPIQAMLLSRRLSHRHFWGLLVFYALTGVLHVLGLAAWIVGAVFTFPVTVLATIYVYRDLAKQAEISL